MLDDYDITSNSDAITDMLADTCELWGLTYYPASPRYDLPVVRVAQTVPCDIVGIEGVNEPTMQERVKSYGINLREYRLITLPSSIITQFPGLDANWQVRTDTGTATEKRYNVLQPPAADQTQPVLLELDCQVIPKPWST